MPKRTGLGKRGLDLLISASGGSVESDTDSGTASGMKSTGKKRTPNSPSEKKPLTGTGSISGKTASGKGSGKKLRTEPKACACGRGVFRRGFEEYSRKSCYGSCLTGRAEQRAAKKEF